MPDADFIPHLFEKKPFTILERDLLSDELRQLSEGIFFKILIWIGMAFAIALLPGRRGNHLSMIQEYGLAKGLLIAFIIIGIPTVWHYGSSWIKFKKDLQKGQKLIFQTTLLNKERSFLRKKYFVLLDMEERDFKKFEVDAAVYHKLQPGHSVWLEYAQYSKQLFKINWQV